MSIEKGMFVLSCPSPLERFGEKLGLKSMDVAGGAEETTPTLSM